MAKHNGGAHRKDSLPRPDPHTLKLFDVKSAFGVCNTYWRRISAEIFKALLTLNSMLRKSAPYIECMDKGNCFPLKHRAIMTTDYWILRKRPSFFICQGQPCSHAFHELIPAKNKRRITCVTPIFTPLYFQTWKAWCDWQKNVLNSKGKFMHGICRYSGTLQERYL